MLKKVIFFVVLVGGAVACHSIRAEEDSASNVSTVERLRRGEPEAPQSDIDILIEKRAEELKKLDKKIEERNKALAEKPWHERHPHIAGIAHNVIGSAIVLFCFICVDSKINNK